MKFYKISSALIFALLLSGCGSSSNVEDEQPKILSEEEMQIEIKENEVEITEETIDSISILGKDGEEATLEIGETEILEAFPSGVPQVPQHTLNDVSEGMKTINDYKDEFKEETEE